jgi:hypothetical protein
MREGAVAVDAGMGAVVAFGIRAGAEAIDVDADALDFGMRVDDAADAVSIRVDPEAAGADATVGIRCGTEAARVGVDVGAACDSGFCRVTRATGFAAGT